MKTIYKYLIVTVLILLPVINSFGQFNASNVSPTDEFGIISFGLNKTFINNQAFDAWTLLNYNLREKNNANGFLDLNVIIAKHFDAGLNVSFNSGYRFNSLYFGGRLTGPRSKISSWLNLEIGEFAAYFSNVVPPDYVLPPEGEGKKTELQYHAAYIGLLTKTYLNFLHGNIKLGKTKIPVNGGFYAGIGFTPFNRNWKYGYYENDSTYIAKRVYSVPKLSKTYIKTGVVVGF